MFGKNTLSHRWYCTKTDLNIGLFVSQRLGFLIQGHRCNNPLAFLKNAPSPPTRLQPLRAEAVEEGSMDLPTLGGSDQARFVFFFAEGTNGEVFGGQNTERVVSNAKQQTYILSQWRIPIIINFWG